MESKGFWRLNSLNKLLACKVLFIDWVVIEHIVCAIYKWTGRSYVGFVVKRGDNCVFTKQTEQRHLSLQKLSGVDLG